MENQEQNQEQNQGQNQGNEPVEAEQLQANEGVGQAETNELTAQPVPEQINWKKEVWEWTQAIVIAVVLALIVRTFICTFVRVEGSSMENTMHTGDHLFVYRLMYKPHNGDIVVFTPERYPKKPYVKRVIATPGQTVDIDYRTGVVRVDGKVLDEPYIKAPTLRAGDVKFPVTVPEGYFFAMGDNRPDSHDCRNSDVGDSDNKSGLVSQKRVMGRALFRMWPFNKFGSLSTK